MMRALLPNFLWSIFRLHTVWRPMVPSASGPPLWTPIQFLRFRAHPDDPLSGNPNGLMQRILSLLCANPSGI